MERTKETKNKKQSEDKTTENLGSFFLLKKENEATKGRIIRGIKTLCKR